MLAEYAIINRAMAKSKNHTSHNQSRKAHRNGLRRRGLKVRSESLRGVRYI